MRKFLTLLFLTLALSSQAQQPKKTTPQKATPTKTAPAKTTTPAKAAPAKTATPAKTAAPAKTTTKPKTPVPATKDIQKLQKEQQNLQKQIKESETMIRSTKDNVSAQLANLAVITGHIDSQKEYVAGIQSEIDTLTINIGALGKDIMFLEEDLEECKRKYSHGLMYMYRNRLMQSKLMFIFSAKNFSQMYRRIRYAQEYTKYQRAQAIVIQKKEQSIRDKQDELKSSNKRKTSLLKEGKEQQRELEKQQRERQGVVNELNKKQQQLQATLADQKRQSQQLNGRIDQLVQQEIRRAEEKRKAEEARRKAEAEKARQRAAAEEARQKAAAEEARRKAEAEKNKSASKKSGKTTTPSTASTEKASKKKAKNDAQGTSAPAASTPKYNAPDNTDRQLSSSFAANQGRLPVPITGSYVISAHYGPYTPEGLNGVTLDNKGTDYSGKSGAQARSIFDGEVTSVFTLGGLTNVIVRHGSYISVYCNLASANVRVGQRVTTRQILGPVARDANGNCTLHFQLRKETSKLNPESWIGK